MVSRPSKDGKELYIHVFYAVMLFITCVLCTYGAGAPFWLNPSNSTVSLGLVANCTDRSRLSTCNRYGNSPTDIPVKSWRGAAGTFVFGIMILWLSFLVSLFTCCCCQNLVKPQRILLPIAAFFVALGIILFGAGFGESFVQLNCGADSQNFRPDICSYGNAGGAAIAGVVFAILSSFISCCVKPEENESHA